MVQGCFRRVHSASMHVDAVKLQLRDGSVLILRAGIDIDNLEAQTPCGFLGIVIAERSKLLKVELLHAAHVLQVEDADGLAAVIHLDVFGT